MQELYVLRGVSHGWTRGRNDELNSVRGRALPTQRLAVSRKDLFFNGQEVIDPGTVLPSVTMDLPLLLLGFSRNEIKYPFLKPNIDPFCLKPNENPFFETK